MSLQLTPVLITRRADQPSSMRITLISQNHFTIPIMSRRVKRRFTLVRNEEDDNSLHYIDLIDVFKPNQSGYSENNQIRSSVNNAEQISNKQALLRALLLKQQEEENKAKNAKPAENLNKKINSYVKNMNYRKPVAPVVRPSPAPIKRFNNLRRPQPVHKEESMFDDSDLDNLDI